MTEESLKNNRTCVTCKWFYPTPYSHNTSVCNSEKTCNGPDAMVTQYDPMKKDRLLHASCELCKWYDPFAYYPNHPITTCSCELTCTGPNGMITQFKPRAGSEDNKNMNKKDRLLHASCELCRWCYQHPEYKFFYCSCDDPCYGFNSINSQFERREEMKHRVIEETTYTVIEETDSYIVCHGSGLTRQEAMMVMFEEISDDSECVDDEFKGLNELKTFVPECNETGFGVTYKCNNFKATLYMLEEPSKEN